MRTRATRSLLGLCILLPEAEQKVILGSKSDSHSIVFFQPTPRAQCQKENRPNDQQEMNWSPNHHHHYISHNNLGFGALAHLPILTLTLKELVLLTILLLPSNSEHL